MGVDEVQRLATRVRAEVGKAVVGHDAVIEGLLVALLVDGHVLLEGPPGTAKTLLARALAASLGLEFNRIQFTPDLLPTDVVGTNLFDFRTSEFRLVRGPVFTDFLLADEINRTPPKTQSALLQAMQERAVTLDGVTHPLSSEFLLVATQNPIEQEGTYPLPEAQLDRFLLKLLIEYPDRSQELDIARRHGHRTASPRIRELGIEAVVDRREIGELRSFVAGLTVSDEVLAYVVDLVRATRERPELAHGASPRAASMLVAALRALSALRGRDFALPDDVKDLLLPVLRHRVVVEPGAEIEGQTAESVLRLVSASVEAPR